jgi:hypothetical protein
VGCKLRIRLELTTSDGDKTIVQSVRDNMGGDDDLGNAVENVLSALEELTGYNISARDVLARAVVSKDEGQSAKSKAFHDAALALLGDAP